MLVWRLDGPLTAPAFEAARGRPPGISLAVILPPSNSVPDGAEVLRIIELCQPHSLLPHHQNPSAFDLQTLLRQPPEDLAAEALDYLAWRGIVLDADTRHIVRRTLELSAEIRTVSALSRSLYLSRRALGRRFLDRGIPVPSHWLHFGRILRACMRLQGPASNLFDVACETGYPDGFALSNQMNRLLGIRPSVAKEHFGWEWLVEAWLRREAVMGGFAPEYSRLLVPVINVANDRTNPPVSTRSRRSAPRELPQRPLQLNDGRLNGTP
jgi:AraC-like DNA-binding protein